MTSPSTLRPPPKQSRAVQTRLKIEAAAVAAIEIYGRDRFTTKHVADLAGVSIGSLYRYFPDRVAILEQVAPVPSNVLVALEVISRALDDDAGHTHTRLELREALMACGELLAPPALADATANSALPRLSWREHPTSA